VKIWKCQNTPYWKCPIETERELVEWLLLGMGFFSKRQNILKLSDTMGTSLWIKWKPLNYVCSLGGWTV
jgi:hypothetical protein